MRAIVVAIVAIPLTATTSWCQAGALRGFVYRDSVGVPLAGAEVAIPLLAKSATTNSAGGFEMRGIREGRWAVRVRKVGFAPVEDSIVVSRGIDLHRDFVLRLGPALLDSVRVSAAPADFVSPAIRGFEERRKMGLGHFITPEEIRKNDHRTLYDLLRGVPGAQILPYRGYRFLGSSRGMAGLLGTKSTVQHAIVRETNSPVSCWPQILIDGVRVFVPNQGMDVPDLSQWQVFELEAVEFYAGAATTPVQYSMTGSACGTLLLWTRERVKP